MGVIIGWIFIGLTIVAAVIGAVIIVFKGPPPRPKR
jgi:hypothetical protein